MPPLLCERHPLSCARRHRGLWKMARGRTASHWEFAVSAASPGQPLLTDSLGISAQEPRAGSSECESPISCPRGKLPGTSPARPERRLPQPGREKSPRQRRDPGQSEPPPEPIAPDAPRPRRSRGHERCQSSVHPSCSPRRRGSSGSRSAGAQGRAASARCFSSGSHGICSLIAGAAGTGSPSCGTRPRLRCRPAHSSSTDGDQE